MKKRLSLARANMPEIGLAPASLHLGENSAVLLAGGMNLGVEIPVAQ